MGILNAVKNLETAIISDLHLLGTNFADPYRFSKLVDNPFIGRIIILGDTFHSEKIGKLNTKEKKIVALIKKIIQSNQKELIILRGNHEKKPHHIENFLGTTLLEQYNLETSKGRYIAIHGDQFYDFRKEAPLMGKIVWMLEKIALLFLPVFVIHIVKKNIGKKIGGKIIEQFKNNAFAFARKENATGIICGHIHFEEINQRDGITYCNAGTWKDGSYPIVFLNENGDIRIEYL